ncbi:MAG: PAS domain S-box protein [Alphaproteobacteria bacterium]|nr:PAS domain S-box protein [Alphaproteobacteria bacterium]
MAPKPPTYTAPILPSGRLCEVVLEHMSDSVIVLDQDWRIIDLNPTAVAEIGAVKGKTLWATIPELEGTPFATLYRRSMTQGITGSYEGYFAPFNNWYAVKAVPVTEGLMIFFRVINLQKQTELALKKSEARLSTIFQTLNQGIIVVDGSGTIVEANPAAARVLRMPPDAIHGPLSRAAGWQFYDSGGNAVAGTELSSFLDLQRGRPVRGKVLGFRRRKDRPLRWLSVDISPLAEHEAEQAGLVCALVADITERRRAEQALLRSKLFLSTAQQVAATGSAAIDFRTDKWDWSDETYRIYGVDPQHFIPSAEALASLVHPADRDELMSKPALARRGIVPPPIEYRILRPDGQERILRRVAALIREPDGTVSGIVGTVQDVTDLRRAQIEQDSLRAQLSHMQRLDALGTLAGGIAHDLNNTLVPVLSLSETVARSLPEDDPRRSMLELVIKAGERGRDLVERILAFARRSEPNKSPVDMSELIRAALELIRASISPSIEIFERLYPVPRIMGDAAQLHQVLINLLTNAAQAIGDKAGLIDVSLSEVPGTGLGTSSTNLPSHVLITVSDSGCGMDAAVQARLFEPFFTTKRSGAGTGLGLSIAQSIVRAHDGQIRFTSRAGAGTRFEVYLPVPGGSGS